jgi:hypothetical protein
MRKSSARSARRRRQKTRELRAPDSETKLKHYYVQESVGIATGFLLATLHMSSLATLTHTPSPMGFLPTVLGRPKNERPFVLIPVGLPSAGATVPVIDKESISEVMDRWLHRQQADKVRPYLLAV